GPVPLFFVDLAEQVVGLEGGRVLDLVFRRKVLGKQLHRLWQLASGLPEQGRRVVEDALALGFLLRSDSLVDRRFHLRQAVAAAIERGQTQPVVGTVTAVLDGRLVFGLGDVVALVFFREAGADPMRRRTISYLDRSGLHFGFVLAAPDDARRLDV